MLVYQTKEQSEEILLGLYYGEYNIEKTAPNTFSTEDFNFL